MKVWKVVLVIFAFLFFIWWGVRVVLPSQIDDVNPLMNCSTEELELADVFYVVPKFGNVSIAEYEVWCEEILAMDKELALHGVYHTYEEFGEFRDEDYLNEGVDIFVDCFGEEPVRFKPPQIAWTSENDWMMGEFDIDLFWNQIFHKVYHCGDSGRFPNWLIRIF